MSGPVEIPTLDQLVLDPGKVLTLPPGIARTLLCGLAGVLPVLIAQSGKDSGKADAPATPEKFLNVAEVVERYGVTEQWLYRHKRELPHSQPSRKVLLFPEEKLRKWFANQKTG
jgi:predicted DNA-binding transcriptional regulator AlpA